MQSVYEINFTIKRNNREHNFVTYLAAKNAAEARKQFSNIDRLGIRSDWETAHRFRIRVKRNDNVSPAVIGFTYAK